MNAQEAFARELEQQLGLQAGAVQVEAVQMQKARYAEDVLRIARHLSADVSATSAGSHMSSTHEHLHTYQ